MKELIHTLIAFLKRDLRSFFSSRSDGGQPSLPHVASQGEQTAQSTVSALAATSEVTSAAPEPGPLAPLPLLLNPAALERLAFRREILDWRDDSILQLSHTADAVLKEFSAHVVRLLRDVPVWRRVFPDTANEILMNDFDSMVRVSIHGEAIRSEKKLKEIVARWENSDTSGLRLIDEWPDSQLRCVANIGFKPSNEAAILKTISHLVLGGHGLADNFHRQAIQISNDVIGRM
jgi:hypothetical protein